MQSKESSFIVEEYKEYLDKYLNTVRSARTHPARLMAISELLRNLFKVEIDDLLPGVETRLGSKILGLKEGRADLVFSYVVFEVKVDLKNELDKAKQQLTKYFQALHFKEPGKRYVGIATDGVQFVAYMPIIENGRVAGLKEISRISIAEAPVLESILWLDAFIFSQPKIKPTAVDLKWRFGPGSPTYQLAIDELTALWNEVKKEKENALKLELWTKNMEIVYGSKPEVATFISHTYLVTLVKLIVYLRLSGAHIIDEDELAKAITGEYFDSYGIVNLIEEDFFTWILHPRIRGRALRLFSDIARQLLRYDLSQIDEDFFKEIYQEIVERGERHRIGEYYTPEWLAELTLRKALEFWDISRRGIPRILDPACGSGTFLCNAIRLMKKTLSEMGKQPEEILQLILNNVVGVDINPLAVIIARANYLLALGDLVKYGGKKLIPIYVADSIKIPKATVTISGVRVYRIDVEIPEGGESSKHYALHIPDRVASQISILSKVVGSFKDAVMVYRERRNRYVSVAVFEKTLETLKAELTENEKRVLKETLEKIFSLIDAGSDSIWVFMLSNIYAPIALTQAKFDLVVGNPPWVAMRYIENKNYQDFLKEQVFSYGLLSTNEVQLFTHMEMATLFFCKCADLYLRDGGLIAFVMPRSVLTGALQHAKFKEFKNPTMKLLRILDLENVTPLFNVPSCVLIAIKGEPNSYPVIIEKYSGKLREKNLRLAEAIKQLNVNEDSYTPPQIPTGESIYHDRFREGATLVPRCFWFVDFVVHPALGVNASAPFVETSADALRGAKNPWKGVKLQGNVEAEFIYATLLGGDIVPFGFTRLRPVVLPIEPTSTGHRLLDVEDLRRRGFKDMASWLDKCQKYWESRRTEKSGNRFPRVIERLDYNNLLSGQNPQKRFVVLYNASGTNIASCVIDKSNLPGFRINQVVIKPRGFIAESTTFFYETDDEDEAYYLCAVLNSNVINDLIKPYQPRGAFGERHIQRRPLMFPIPEFNRNDPRHVQLANISKTCHKKVSLMSMVLGGMTAAKARSTVKQLLAKELKEIDKLVSELLRLSS
ncbi:MAG: N-6 DNA methylase [Desulfurococcaceae archaeon]